MRIHDQNLGGAAAPGAGRAPETQRAERGGSSRSGAPGPGDDRVELSNSLGSLSRAVALNQSDRAARVLGLAAEYAAGRYRAEPAATSRAMIADALAPGME